MYILVIMWMIGGYAPIIEEYEFEDSGKCYIALSNATIKPAPEGHSHLVIFCKPKV